jgi:streptomycin 6-kinase
VSRPDIAVPRELSDNVERWFGKRGRQWVAAVPATVAILAERWELRLGSPYPGGSHALVLRATMADGTAAVLKVPFRDDENYAEAAALRAYDGDGAVRLLAYDEGSGALLLERAEPGSPLARHPDRTTAIGIACGLLRRLRRPAPPGEDFPSAAALAKRWAAELPQRQRRHRLTGGDALVDEAAGFARQYADRPDGPPLLINRDAHLGNVVRAQRGRWLLIDPKPVVGEAAFEAAHPVLRTLAEATGDSGGDPRTVAQKITVWSIGLGVDPARVRAWALVRAVDNALWSAEIGADPIGDLRRAAALATSPN